MNHAIHTYISKSGFIINHESVMCCVLDIVICERRQGQYLIHSRIFSPAQCNFLPLSGCVGHGQPWLLVVHIYGVLFGHKSVRLNQKEFI